jgi:Glycosyl hydrolase family 26
MRKTQHLGTSATWTRRSIALLAATSAALAATISFGAIASAAGPNGQQRRPVVADVTKPAAAAPIAPATPSPTSTSSPLLEGAYVGAADPSGVSAFDAATGTHASIATDYLPGNAGFSGMDGANGSLNWLLGPYQGSGLTLSLGVPIIPTNAAGTAVATLAAGATGFYNPAYVTLAQTLVAAGEANAYLRLGWEFDGSWMPWNATTPAAEASYAAYFDQIVTAMRSVPGAAFRYVWNPDAGAFTQAGYNVALAYPGNAFVDVIGLDAYDQTWVSPQTPANAWNQGTLPALAAAETFAAAAAKPVALAEWGVALRSDGHGLGDDPTFVTNMAAWMHNPANDVVFEAYFDVNSGGVNSDLTGGSFPQALAAFHAALG